MTRPPAGPTKLLFLLVLSAFAFGCNGAEPDGARSEGEADVQRSSADTAARGSPEQAADAPYRPMAVEEGGVVRGTLRYSGEPPNAEIVSVPEDRRSVCGETVSVRPIELGSEGGLRNAVVSIRSIARGRPFSDSSAVLDQRECRFRPKVVVVSVGGELIVENSDPFTHNVHTVAFDNRPENRSQPPGVDLSLDFAVPERLRIACDIHGWMGASVVVSHHPYHAVTDADGGFTLEDVPPGTYTLEAWHPELGTVEREVTVQGGTSSSVSLMFPG